MEMDIIVVGPYDVNCFLLSNSKKKTLIIDPGEDSAKIAARIEKRGLEVEAYLLTHGHMDHISALADLSETYPAPIMMHASDLAWAFTDANQTPPYYYVPRRPRAQIGTFADGDRPLADWDFDVVHTPGHTPGCVCFHFPDENLLISGDTLFRGSVGRTDLPGGSPRVLGDSLKRLKKLPAHTKVYPGHGESTTIEYELAHNIFMK